MVASFAAVIPVVVVAISVDGCPAVEVIVEAVSPFVAWAWWYWAYWIIRIESMFEFPVDVVAFAVVNEFDEIDRSPVFAWFIDPFNRFGPSAHTSAIHDSNLAEVVVTFYERSLIWIIGIQLAEWINSVVVEDRHTVD